MNRNIEESEFGASIILIYYLGYLLKTLFKLFLPFLSLQGSLLGKKKQSKKPTEHHSFHEQKEEN